MKTRVLAAVFFLGLVVSAVAQNTGTANGLARQLNDAFASVYEKVAPAVVIVEVRRSSDVSLSGLPEGLEFFFRGPDGAPTQTNQGSGFIISADGYILTNDHVVGDSANDGITVKLKDGRKFSAKLVGMDDKSDLAVIKIEARNLPTVELGDSDAAKVGQFAFAIGAPFELPYTFTVGVISAKGRNNLTNSRSYEEYIQTDASINPGNSGGPLCDIEGRVVGVNTLIYRMNRGLGFAIPINLAREVSQQLIANGRVSRSWLGIEIMGIEESEALQRYFPDLKQGVVVNGIQPGTPAASSDLRAGDVILKVDNVPVSLSRDVQREILGKKVGQSVSLELWRNGKISSLTMRTGEQPDRLMRASNQPVLREPPAKPSEPPPSNFGLVVEDMPAGSSVQGVRVIDIAPGSAADAAGLIRGDVITEVAGKPVRGTADFDAAVSGADLSRGMMLLVDRGGERTFAILKP
ncbi:MAG TPA: trypsin-like peptidase domain-containing protein [Terrimicrobiaceae bacterium]|nr:trypsin-like peptidase domain-containing protein [Terrimicrobiaceae bacterium]